jgi:hypothetical protein
MMLVVDEMETMCKEVVVAHLRIVYRRLRKVQKLSRYPVFESVMSRLQSRSANRRTPGLGERACRGFVSYFCKLHE